MFSPGPDCVRSPPCAVDTVAGRTGALRRAVDVNHFLRGAQGDPREDVQDPAIPLQFELHAEIGPVERVPCVELVLEQKGAASWRAGRVRRIVGRGLGGREGFRDAELILQIQVPKAGDEVRAESVVVAIATTFVGPAALLAAGGEEEMGPVAEFRAGVDIDRAVDAVGIAARKSDVFDLLARAGGVHVVVRPGDDRVAVNAAAG